MTLTEPCQEMYCTFNPAVPHNILSQSEFKAYSCVNKSAQQQSDGAGQTWFFHFGVTGNSRWCIVRQFLTVKRQSREYWHGKFWAILLEPSVMFYWCSILCVKQPKNCNVLTMKLSFKRDGDYFNWKPILLMIRAYLLHFDFVFCSDFV